MLLGRLAGNIAVVDTDVFSYVWKKDSRARPYLEYLEGRFAAISLQTVAELLYGAFKRGYSATTFADLKTAMRRYYNVPYNADMAEWWGKITAAREKAGHRIHEEDAWVAATALFLKESLGSCPLATHNRRDFEGILGLEVITFAP